MNTPQDPFESRLRQRMQSTPIDLPAASGPHAAADRAAERFRRRRTTLVAAAAIAIVGGITAPALLGSDDDAGVNTEFAAPIDANGLELDWQVHDDGLAMVRSADQGSEGFYALSTGPGTRYEDYPDGDIPRALYRWDGAAWQVIESDSDQPARISERDGTLYALSTAADTGAPVGSVSTDGGESWTAVPLGSIQPPNDTLDWTLSVQLDLASTADTTVAVVNARFHLPMSDIFPELDQGSYAYEVTPDGVDLVTESHSPETQAGAIAAGLDPSELSTTTTEVPEDVSVVRSVTWAELGVAGPEALRSHVTSYSADGDTWTPIETGPTQGSNVDSLVATDDGILFQGTIWSDSGAGGTDVVFHTVDGLTWQPVALPAAAEFAHTVLAPNGSIMQVTSPGDRSEEATAAVSNDLGATWATIDLTQIAPGLADTPYDLAAYSGPLGVALIAQSSGDEDGPGVRTMLFSNDLQSWSVTDLESLLPDDAPYAWQVLVGNDQVIVQASGPGEPDDGMPDPTATLVATPVR